MLDIFSLVKFYNGLLKSVIVALALSGVTELDGYIGKEMYN